MNGRQTKILEMLQTCKELSVQEGAGQFGVAAATIRRDFQYLEEEGRLVRTHGGAALSRTGLNELAFLEKGRRFESQKRAIGRAVAAEIKPGMTISLDTGSTTLAVARAILAIANLKVLTTSLPVAAVLHSQENLEVILMGGTVRKNDPDLSGILTEQNLRCFRVDLAVMGADAVTPEGVFTADLNVARGAQAMMAGAARRVLAVDSSKFARQALYRYAGWTDFAKVFTDDGAPPEARQWLEALPVAATLVPVRGQPEAGLAAPSLTDE